LLEVPNICEAKVTKRELDFASKLYQPPVIIAPEKSAKPGMTDCVAAEEAKNHQ
jgi:hypothetical protein